MDDRRPLMLPSIQALEPRRLLSTVTRTGETLRIFGDPGVNNVITLSLDEDKDVLTVNVNGQVQTFDRDDLELVRVFGADGDDVITMDQSQATFNLQADIYGQGGNDRIRAGGERDYIDAGTGDDRVSCGGGRNIVYLRDGNDIANGGDQRDFISGGNGADFITGSGNRDELNGDNGNDTIYGDYTTDDPENEDSYGSDLIFGGRGHDWISGGLAKDVCFGNDGNDTVIGGSSRDELFGNVGNDSLDGGGDNDSLWGGGGADTLVGGGGRNYITRGELKDIDKFTYEIRSDLGDF